MSWQWLNFDPWREALCSAMAELMHVELMAFSGDTPLDTLCLKLRPKQNTYEDLVINRIIGRP